MYKLFLNGLQTAIIISRGVQANKIQLSLDLRQSGTS